MQTSVGVLSIFLSLVSQVVGVVTTFVIMVGPLVGVIAIVGLFCGLPFLVLLRF